VGGALASIATLMATLGFKKWGWPRLKNAAGASARFFHGVAAIGELQSTVNKIHKEMVPNGGGSLRDVVNRTELALTVFINSSRAQWDGMGMFGVFEAAPTGEFIYVNNTLQKWTNRSEFDFHGYGWINSVTLEHREHVRQEWESCLEDAREFSMDFSMRRVDGSEFPVSWTASPITNRTGGPIVKWVGVVRRLNIPGESHAAPH
jgi:PAS domain S-box-containing protein